MQTYPEKFREKDPKKIKRLLNESALSQLVDKARYLLEIQECLYSCLADSEMAPHCRVMNIDDQTLAIEVSNSAVATRLRYEQQALMDRINEALPQRKIRLLRIKVRP